MSSQGPCGCRGLGHAQDADEDDGRRRAATRNTTDLRRARQRARAVIGDIEEEVVAFLEEHDVERVVGDAQRERQLNEALSRLAAVRLQQELIQWLAQRRRQTWGRGVRHSMDLMQTTLQETVTRPVTRAALSGAPDFSAQDRRLNRIVTRIDAGLLTDGSDSLAEEIGDRITRQLQVGVRKGEPLRSTDPDALDLGTRVAMVLSEGDHPRRQEAGVTGQTAQSKAELIAHDSVEQAYNVAATERYLRNGFRYVIYDAVCDLKTSALCRRLGECDGPPVVIDLTETPWLVPPNHPWCRSSVRPTLNREGRQPITEDRIADGHLQTIFATESYRPTVLDVERTLQRTPLQRAAEGAPGGA